MPAMPVTIVRKITGAMIILTSLMKRIAERLQRLAGGRREMAEQHAGDDRDQHLDIEMRVPGAGRREYRRLIGGIDADLHAGRPAGRVRFIVLALASLAATGLALHDAPRHCFRCQPA